MVGLLLISYCGRTTTVLKIFIIVALVFLNILYQYYSSSNLGVYLHRVDFLQQLPNHFWGSHVLFRPDDARWADVDATPAPVAPGLQHTSPAQVGQYAIIAIKITIVIIKPRLLNEEMKRSEKKIEEKSEVKSDCNRNNGSGTN